MPPDTTPETVGHPITPARMAVLIEAANRLSDARRTHTPFADLPPEFQPADLTEAYAVQDLVAQSLGDTAGWKVGASAPDATPLFAPMPMTGIAPGGSVVRAIRYRGTEAEVAFLLGADLPPRAAKPYSRDEVLAAVASCHPAIEILDSGLLDPPRASRFAYLGDLQMHGAFIYGSAFAGDWRSIDWSSEHVTLAIDGSIRIERTGSNTAGDLLRLLSWLANEAAWRTRGLRAGQWITTGSWTGNTLAEKESAVDVRFSTLGRVTARFAPEQELEKGLPGPPTTSFP